MQSVLPSQKKQSYSVPNAIGQKLSDLRGLISRFVVSQSLIILAMWFLTAFWTFGLLDYLPARMGAAESPQSVRFVMLCLWLAVSLYLIYRLLWQRWKVRWSDSALALLIENKHPEFQSSLVTTVQAAKPSGFVDPSAEEHPSRAGLLEMASNRACDLIDAVDVNQLVRFRPLQLQLVALGVLLGSSCVAALIQPAWTFHWASRFFALSNTPWPRATELGVHGIEMDVPTFTGQNTRQRYLVPFHDGIALVPKGQSCQLKTYAKLSGKIVPDVCTVYYRETSGNRGRANMRRLSADKNQQTFALDGPPFESINESLSFSVTGGDARISDLLINSIEPPIVAEMQINVTYPQYLQRSTKTTWGNETIAYRTGMRLPMGSQIELLLKANSAIDRCDYVIVRSGAISEKTSTPEQVLSVAGKQANFKMPLGNLDGNLLIELRLWGVDGICSTRVQQFVIAAINDQPPQVDLVLQGIGSSITEDAILPVSGKIKDDYDVKEAWVETALDATPSTKTPVRVEPDGKALTQLDLKLLRDEGKLSAKVGSTIALTLAADDFLDLRSEPHVGRASPIQLSVVTIENLQNILDRREMAMKARLKLIIEELTQMQDLLVNMQRAASANPPSADNAEAATEATGETVEQGENSAERQARIQTLRSQQAETQLSKSEGELRGVEREIGQINQELINNRIDSIDRRTRLEDKIRAPLLVILNQMWPPLANDIRAIEKGFARTKKAEMDTSPLLTSAIEKSTKTIVALNAILEDMIKLLEFNELTDAINGMLEDQGKILEKTKQEQKKQVLDLLK